MVDTFFSPAGVLSSLVDFIGAFAAVGVGIAVIGWLLGYVIFWIIDALRF